MKEKLKLLKEKIWDLKVDAIFCHANTELGLEEEDNRKIMEKGGDSIQKECNQFSNLQKGKAVITGAGKLPSKHIIHIILNDTDGSPEEDILMAAIKEGLNLAKEKQFKSIGIPLLGQSNEIPVKRAAELILTEVKKHLESESTIESIVFVADEYYSYDALEEGIRQL